MDMGGRVSPDMCMGCLELSNNPGDANEKKRINATEELSGSLDNRTPRMMNLDGDKSIYLHGDTRRLEESRSLEDSLDELETGQDEIDEKEATNKTRRLEVTRRLEGTRTLESTRRLEAGPSMNEMMSANDINTEEALDDMELLQE